MRLMLDYAVWMLPSCKVYVLTGNITDDYSEYQNVNEVIMGVNIFRFKVFFKTAAKRNINIVSPLLLWKAFLIVLNSQDKVVLHVCELRGIITLYALLLKLLFSSRVKLVHSAFGMLHEKNSLIRQVYDFIFLKKILSNIALDLVQNKHEEDVFNKMVNSHIQKKVPVLLTPLHFTINKEQSIPKTKMGDIKKILRTKYEIPREALVFIFLGRFCAEKGILRTIDAFSKFKESKKNSFLIIAGKDFNYKGKITQYVQNNNLTEAVKLVDNISSERFEYYSLSDIFIAFPIIYEETMLASVEALSCGTPIIVSKEADIPYVAENSAGFVIDYSVRSATIAMDIISNELQIFETNAYNVALKYFQDLQHKEQLTKALVNL